MQAQIYTGFTKALAESGQPVKALDALCQLTQELVGAKLFTLMTYSEKLGYAQRTYSNMPDAYPVSGRKPANHTHWSTEVIEERRIFVANTIEDIAKVFNDHELIQSLGCESVINVPVEIDGEVVGTVNCLHEAGYYTPERVKAAEAIRLPAQACFLLGERNEGKGA